MADGRSRAKDGAMRLRAGVAIDLGTVNTLICVAGRGLVLEEPSAIAVDRSTGSVAVVCVPGGATWVERRSLAAAVGSLRPRCAVRLIDEPVAAAAGAGVDLAAGSGAFVVDIGGGTTEIAVLAGGHVVRARSLRTGGNAMDEAIVHAVKAELGLLIGRNAARNLKTALGLAESETGPVEVVGVDGARRTPRVERVPGRLIAAALEHCVAAIVDDPLRCVVRGAAEILRHGQEFPGRGEA